LPQARDQRGEVLQREEPVRAHDHFLTPTARHADVVLPATTFWERNDVHTPWAGAGHYAIYMKQAIEPMYECRNDMAIFADLAARLGINDYDDKTEEQWLRELTKGAVGDFEAFRENGVARFAAPKDAVAFAQQIRDPDNHKFTTPSGKIEIYSMAMAAKPDPYGLGDPIVPTGAEHSESMIVRRPDRSAKRRDLPLTIGGLSWRGGPSAAPRVACPERSRGARLRSGQRFVTPTLFAFPCRCFRPPPTPPSPRCRRRL